MVFGKKEDIDEINIYDLENEYFGDVAATSPVGSYALLIAISFISVVGFNIIPIALLFSGVRDLFILVADYLVTIAITLVFFIVLQNIAMRALNEIEELHDVIVVTDANVYRFPFELEKTIELKEPNQIFTEMSMTTKAYSDFVNNRAIIGGEAIETEALPVINMYGEVEKGVLSGIKHIEDELSHPSFANIMDRKWDKWLKEKEK